MPLGFNLHIQDCVLLFDANDLKAAAQAAFLFFFCESLLKHGAEPEMLVINQWPGVFGGGEWEAEAGSWLRRHQGIR